MIFVFNCECKLSIIPCSYLLTIVCDFCMWISWTLVRMLYLRWNLPKENIFTRKDAHHHNKSNVLATQLLNPKILSFTLRCHNKKNRGKVVILKKQLIYGPTLIRSCGDFLTSCNVMGSNYFIVSQFVICLYPTNIFFIHL